MNELKKAVRLITAPIDFAVSRIAFFGYGAAFSAVLVTGISAQLFFKSDGSLSLVGTVVSKAKEITPDNLFKKEDTNSVGFWEQ